MVTFCFLLKTDWHQVLTGYSSKRNLLCWLAGVTVSAKEEFELRSCETTNASAKRSGKKGS